MFGRIIFARRYLKILLLSFVLIVVLYELVILSSSGTGIAAPKLLQSVHDYLKHIDYKDYLSSLKPENQHNATYEDQSEVVSSQSLPWFHSGQFDTSFFHRFRFHNFKGSSLDTYRSNQELYTEMLDQKISEPKTNNLKRPSENYQLANATLLSLVRNSEMEGIISAMKEVEKTFNAKFHYPWTFINDDEFTAEFKEKVSSETESECFFITISPELWNKPSFIDEKIEAQKIKEMLAKEVGYADMESYHNMCRFYSGTFYNLPHLKNYKYYWRVEPDTKYYCDIGYDVFKFMEDNNKTYGFNINLYDGPDSITSLWNTTVDFLEENHQYLHPNAAFDWLLEDMQNPSKNRAAGYSTCHFWLNFEIADMDFYRGEAYTKWFQYLDNSGGFYYERWGDAPVHAVGLGLFEDKSKIHWFRDIGYNHFPYLNCPNSEKCDDRCKPGTFVPWTNLRKENCMGNWIRYGLSEDEKNMW